MSEPSVSLPLLPIVGSSPVLRQALDRAVGLARERVPVLIVAEKGLETTALAALIHSRSGRTGSFHRIFAPELADPEESGDPNPGIYTRSLVHKILHEAIARAQGGSLLIEEIIALPWFAQAILEDLLEQQARGAPGADVRVIATTSVDLYLEAGQGELREGLLSRLLVATLSLPPLRLRGRDVAEIAEHTLHRHATLSGRPPVQLSPDAVDELLARPWPGNLPELETVLVRAAIEAGGQRVGLDHLEQAQLGVATAFDDLWPDEGQEEEPPGRSLLRELEPPPSPEPVRVEMVNDALAARVFGKEILAASNLVMKEHALSMLTIALRRVMERLDVEGVLHERDLRDVTLLRGKQAPRLLEVLVEDGVVVLAPATGRKRAWSRAPEA